MASLYDTVGGSDAVNVVVDALYVRLLADPVVAPYFEHVDMRQLKRHQRAFIAGALGGPDLYRGRDMGSAHAGLGITSQAFDRVVAHLADALASAGVSDEIIGQIAGSLAPLRGVVTAIPA